MEKIQHAIFVENYGALNLNELIEDNISCTNVCACSTAGVNTEKTVIRYNIKNILFNFARRFTPSVLCIRYLSLVTRAAVHSLETTLGLIIFPTRSSPTRQNKTQCGFKRTARALAIVTKNCSVIICNGRISNQQPMEL